MLDFDFAHDLSQSSLLRHDDVNCQKLQVVNGLNVRDKEVKVTFKTSVYYIEVTLLCFPWSKHNLYDVTIT